MDPVSKSSKEWDSLKDYVKNTHGQTHNMTVEVKQAFRVERQEETDAWIKAGNDGLADGERLLLWHGSRTTNFAGILKQGLRIAPPEGLFVSFFGPSDLMHIFHFSSCDWLHVRKGCLLCRRKHLFL